MDRKLTKPKASLKKSTSNSERMFEMSPKSEQIIKKQQPYMSHQLGPFSGDEQSELGGGRSIGGLKAGNVHALSGERIPNLQQSSNDSNPDFSLAGKSGNLGS